jgi:hypothetical protein
MRLGRLENWPKESSSRLGRRWSVLEHRRGIVEAML